MCSARNGVSPPETHHLKAPTMRNTHPTAHLVPVQAPAAPLAPSLTIPGTKVAPVPTARLYGRDEPVRILAQHPAGTIDVERLSDGRCFRVSGLGLAA